MNNQLIQDMLNFAEAHTLKIKRSRALTVYLKCVKMGKFNLAKKIEDKYGKDFIKSDRALSFMYGMLAMRKL
jgi:hypothetical protein